MHRLFVAIRPPGEIRDAVIDLMEGVPGARWQDDAQLHITLRFIGEVDGRTAEDVASALDSIRHPAFPLSLRGVGSFGGRGRATALWAGLYPHEPLAHLHRKIDQALIRVGLQPERRAYLPHLTLARLSRGDAVAIDSFFARNSSFGSPAFDVDRFWLYQSHLGQAGATYEKIHGYHLSGE
jgi:RNA 2',3'-cyclic 3'-phosphodiesterase